MVHVGDQGGRRGGGSAVDLVGWRGPARRGRSKGYHFRQGPTVEEMTLTSLRPFLLRSSGQEQCRHDRPGDGGRQPATRHPAGEAVQERSVRAASPERLSRVGVGVRALARANATAMMAPPEATPWPQMAAAAGRCAGARGRPAGSSRERRRCYRSRLHRGSLRTGE